MRWIWKELWGEYDPNTLYNCLQELVNIEKDKDYTKKVKLTTLNYMFVLKLSIHVSNTLDQIWYI